MTGGAEPVQPSNESAPQAAPTKSGALDTNATSQSTNGVAAEVTRYLEMSQGLYVVGQPEYYARKALEQASTALSEGNYGIGAIAILVKDGLIYEFPNRNAMVTGLGLHDHAEARALDDLLAYKQRVLEGRKLAPQEELRVHLVEPAERYSVELNDATRSLSEGIHVFGTLEPCPMCACMLINSGAQTSTSNALDGELEVIEGRLVSNGAASVIGEKLEHIPVVWQYISKSLGLEFSLLSSNDTALGDLSARVFLETREAIDERLGKAEKPSNETGVEGIELKTESLVVRPNPYAVDVQK